MFQTMALHGDPLAEGLAALDTLGVDADDPVIAQLAAAARRARDAGRLQVALLFAMVASAARERERYAELIAGACALRVLREMGEDLP